MLERVWRMREHGMRAGFVQGANDVLENFAHPLLQEIRRPAR
jgi:hypothetical protein